MENEREQETIRPPRHRHRPPPRHRLPLLRRLLLPTLWETHRTKPTPRHNRQNQSQSQRRPVAHCCTDVVLPRCFTSPSLPSPSLYTLRTLSLPLSTLVERCHSLSCYPLANPLSNPLYDLTSHTYPLTQHDSSLQALHDLEKSGLIKVKNGGAVIQRQIFTWIDNND